MNEENHESWKRAKVDYDDNDDTVVLLEFFRQATQSLNNLMILYQQKSYDDDDDDDDVDDSGGNHPNKMDNPNDQPQSQQLPSLSSSTSASSLSIIMSLSDIRTLLLSKQTACLASSIDTCLRHENSPIAKDYSVEKLQAALQSCRSNIRGVDATTTTSTTSATTSTSSSSSSSLLYAMELMNETARRTFCYLVLWYEFRYDAISTMMTGSSKTQHDGDRRQLPQLPPRTLISYSNHNHLMNSSDVLEFCGLCSTAIRISDVVRYLQYGTPIFPNMMKKICPGPDASVSTTTKLRPDQSYSETMKFPQERLQYIQRSFLRAIGYDPDYGTKLIQEMFYTTTSTGSSPYHAKSTGVEYSIDTNVEATFRNMELLMEQTLQDITRNITKETFMRNSQSTAISDPCDDGVTRVVAVSYSEKYIDPQTGQEITSMQHDHDDHSTSNNEDSLSGAPQSLTMMKDDDNDDIPMTTTTTTVTNTATTSASATIASNIGRNDETWELQKAQLEQEILAELLSLRDEERDRRLRIISSVVEKIMDHIQTIPKPQDRITYLINLDYKSQRCLATKKIWDNMLEQNNNQAPRTNY